MSESVAALIGTWVALSIISFALGIIQIYAYCKYKALQHFLIINKRYPSIVLIEAIVSTVNLFIAMPLGFKALFISAPIFESDTLDQFVFYFGIISSSITGQFIVNIEAARLWLLSFDLQYLKALKDEQWKSKIDEAFSNKNWYLRNKQAFGNRNFVIRRVMIYFVFVAFMVTIAFIFADLHLAQLIDSFFYLVAVFTMIIIYCRCPKHLNEHFFIQFEFQATILIFSIVLCMYLAGVFFEIIQLNLVNVILASFGGVLGLSFPSLLSTLVVPNKILLSDLWSAGALHIAIKAHQTVTAQPVKTIRQRVLDLLRNEKEFETAFVHWMYGEFSPEVILSFIEFVQYKQSAIDYINHKMEKEAKPQIAGVTTYDLYGSIPKSFIVYGDKNTDIGDMGHFKNVAHLLFEKYVKSNSELEVNISCDLRNKYYGIEQIKYQNLNMSDIVTLFDDLIEEMFDFITQSYIRYEKNQS